jgi:class 3 adenylate cyclase
MAIAMRDAMTKRTTVWRQRGHQLDFTVGITLGYATIGKIGFEGRYEYGAVGSVLNLASRLSDEAGPGQILMSARALASAEKQVEAERIPDLKLKGFAKPVMAYSVRRMRTAAPDAPPTSSDAKKAAPG